jgi:hypothetical protein
MARAFVIRPFGKKKDSADMEIDFERVQAELIDPALQSVGFEGGTTGEIIDSGNIRADMFGLILQADFVVCDLTILNANVFYELGIRHALRKKRTILIKGVPTGDNTPFDLLTDRYLPYPIDKPGDAKDDLIATLKASLLSDRETDSPIFQLLPSLAEADPSTEEILPVDFREEVARAAAAGRKGWLRLLSEEVRPTRFEWGGLKLVAKRQWDVKDYEGARRSWELVRDVQPGDVDANLALANIYERLFKEKKEPYWMEYSDQAIDRVLVNGSTTTLAQKAEALTLKGRNQKTRWRLELGSLSSKEERRRKALTRKLLGSYQAYYEAYLKDLNHFYPGLNALQMATILSDLSSEKDGWYEIFETDEEAESERKALEDRIPSLRSLVPLAVEAGLKRMSESDPDRIWAEISAADLLFLFDGQRKGRVVAAYRDAIPLDKAFAWDAARGQLQLFADLGVREELAREVIQALDARFGGDSDKADAGKKPVHLVLFAGHRVDEPGREEPRFPATKEARVRTLIREALEKLIDDEHEVLGLASAAPGTDILAHEVCEALGVPATICLPMPREAAARVAFNGLDAWRNRFLDLTTRHELLVLSDREGLPRWLEGSGLDPWERGNRWVMKMAETWGAKRISLVAVWDGKPAGDKPGGTAQFVKLAADSGMVRIERIDTSQLLPATA